MVVAKTKKFAAIDLGSNSFHLIVAKFENDSLKIIDRVKVVVRLADGLDDKGNLSQEKINLATECLKIFGQRLKEFSTKNVKCVGTNTLRKANNSYQFIVQAEQALGFPISIIGGREEARLVYQGAARSISQTVDRRLVIDIGGGSTEFIIGESNHPLLTESLSMGCVNFTKQFFSKGKITKKKTKKAILAARQKIEWISDEYVDKGWQEVIGSSGTIKSVASILEQKYDRQGVIEKKYLVELLKVFIEIKNIEDIELEGLSENRAPIIIGGICVLLAAFQELGIKTMMVSSGALREGLLLDMQNVAGGRDIRFTAVKQMIERYKVDTKHVRRINIISSVFIKYFDLKNDSEVLNLIKWAIELHEIGLLISHVNTARHSAYIIEQSDMPGFSRGLQNTIGFLVRLHRGKIKNKTLEDWPIKSKQLFLILFIVRLSIMLARGRHKVNLEAMTVSKTFENIDIVFPEKYLEEHPLTVADLEQEKKECKKFGFNLCFRDGIEDVSNRLLFDSEVH